MYKLVRQLFSLLTAQQRKRLYALQLLMLLMAFMEVVGIAAIGPFMALIGDISLIEKNKLVAKLYAYSEIGDPYNFLFVVGVAVLCTLGVASLTSLVTSWRLSIFAFKVGTEISDRLYRHYLRQNWLFHSSESSAQLIKQVSTESVRITSQVILPLIQMNAKIVLAVFIVATIFIYNPVVAVTGFLIFFVAYLSLYKTIKNRLKKNGNEISEMAVLRFRLMNEGFGGIRDILLLDRSKDFIDKFERSGKRFAYSNGENNALSIAPRYLMEFIAFGAMIGLILVLIKTYKGDLSAVLPLLAVYALAGLKLLPAVQQIYASIALIKGNIAAFEEIKPELISSQQSEQELHEQPKMDSRILTVNERIEIKHAEFTYPNKPTPALSGFSMSIPSNKTIGIVGASGAGKSTATDLLLGLIEPEKGELVVDGIVINDTNRRSWQNSIGFVPQSIFLGEGTIAENVAFGLPKEEIDIDQVRKAVRLARLEEMVNQLPKGLDTTVGERGVQLSGGQRQRIGIARALYMEAPVLVFDEATSALDGITEKLIMEAIHGFSGEKTIIMVAHRLKTIEKCDVIFYLDKGRVADVGTYKMLLESNESFRELAKHA